MVLKHKMEDEKANFTGLKENSSSLLPHINTKEIFSSFNEHSVLHNIKTFAQDELDLKMHGSESLPIYFGRKK